MAETFSEQFEKYPEYKTFQNTVQKILSEQWEHVVYSGIVNSLYTQYANYFINRRGPNAKVKKSKEEDEIRSKKELRDKMRENEASDKFLVDSKFLDLVALTALISGLVGKSMKSIASYYGFKAKTKLYLNLMANRAGQDVIYQITKDKAIKFRLSQAAYKELISKRVIELISTLDKTTKSKLIAEILKGIKAGETKTQMVRRLQEVGKSLAKDRARLIAITETESITEFMRYEVARRNGVQKKEWITRNDERVCPICGPLGGKKINIDENFESSGWSGPTPPAHIRCRCGVQYDVSSALCSNYSKSSLKERLLNLVLKAKSIEEYKSIKWDCPSCVNANALWAGGESLVGPDKQVGNYYSELKDITGKDRREKLETYKEILTPDGYIQLRMSLGLKPNINSK